MTTSFIESHRQRKVIRRKRFLTIHFSERRSGLDRRTEKGQKINVQSKKENGKG